MSMRDEPWEILRGQPRSPKPHFLSPDEAQARFGELRKTRTDGLFPVTRYRTIEDPDGRWEPVTGRMKELTGYKLVRKR